MIASSWEKVALYAKYAFCVSKSPIVGLGGEENNRVKMGAQRHGRTWGGCEVSDELLAG